MRKKIGIIVQCRSTSKRLPGKVLKKIRNFTLVEILFNRLKKSKNSHKLIFAIPLNKNNDDIYNHLKKIKALIYRGSETNVLDRYYNAAKENNISTIVRVTGDCPLTDPALIDKLINEFNKSNLDYISTSPKTFPDGFDIEIFSFQVLKKMKKITKNQYDLEHVTSYIRRNKEKFKTKEIHFDKDFSFIKLSIDNNEDLLRVKKVFHHFKPNIYFSIYDIFNKRNIDKILNKELKNKNHLQIKNKNGQKIWNRAKKNIAGGNMILSKNPERFLPNLWPTYFKSSKGCKIIDYDNNSYIDMSLMGVGTNVLGYANSKVDEAVKKSILKGNMSTLNCKEEVLLAEKIISLHPWFEKVKFARSGGEANSIAIRLARAYSNKDNIAVCGYHGWHDWYLSANLNDKKNTNLNTHLLKGLEVAGVPKKLAKTVYPFEYGNFDQLKKIYNANNIGVIKMEVCRNTVPNIAFLKKVRKFANKKKIILIFDECTTGFRETLGGIHRDLLVKPDMCIFGKALGNGYAITAVAGKKDIMDSVEKSFISSTFWSERIGFVAALKTIEIMEKNHTWKTIKKIGQKIQNGWKKSASKAGLDLNINGIPSLASFSFKENNEEYKTLITQEMLKKNFLASNKVYCSLSHTDKILSRYFNNLEKIFRVIKSCEENKNINVILKSQLPIVDFKRLN